MRFVCIALVASALSTVSAITPAMALTFKKGEVLGADGKVYSGASPAVAENLAKKAQQEDFFGNKKTAGVVGNNVFVVVNGTTTFIPLSDIKGKSDEAIEKIIVDAVVENVTRVAAEAAAAASELNESLQISADGSLPDLSGVAPEALAVPGFTPPSAEELAAMTDEEIIATLEQRQEALAAIQAADTANISQITEGFSDDISVEDLQEATEYAAEFAAQEAANIAAAQAQQAAFEAAEAAQQAVDQAAQEARIAAGEAIEGLDYELPSAEVCAEAAGQGVSLGGC